MSERYQSGFMMPPVTDEERWNEAERIMGEILDGTALDAEHHDGRIVVTCIDDVGETHHLGLLRKLDRRGKVQRMDIRHTPPIGDGDLYTIQSSDLVYRNIADSERQMLHNKRRLAKLLSRVVLVGIPDEDSEMFERIAAYSSRGSESRTNPLYMRGGYNALYQRQLTSAPHSATE